jgi:hypothetical protein
MHIAPHPDSSLGYKYMYIRGDLGSTTGVGLWNYQSPFVRAIKKPSNSSRGSNVGRPHFGWKPNQKEMTFCSQIKVQFIITVFRAIICSPKGLRRLMISPVHICAYSWQQDTWKGEDTRNIVRSDVYPVCNGDDRALSPVSDVDCYVIIRELLETTGRLRVMSSFPWLINGNPDNNVESLCIFNTLSGFTRHWDIQTHLKRTFLP